MLSCWQAVADLQLSARGAVVVESVTSVHVALMSSL